MLRFTMSERPAIRDGVTARSCRRSSAVCAIVHEVLRAASHPYVHHMHLARLAGHLARVKH